MAKKEYAEAKVKTGFPGNAGLRVKNPVDMNPYRRREPAGRPTPDARSNIPEINLHYYGP